MTDFILSLMTKHHLVIIIASTSLPLLNFALIENQLLFIKKNNMVIFCWGKNVALNQILTKCLRECTGGIGALCLEAQELRSMPQFIG